MELRNYEERFFWKKIYNSVIRAGNGPLTAQCWADTAVQNLRDSPVVTRPR